MPKDGSGTLICAACKQSFQRRSSKGRRPAYCGSACRSTAYRGRNGLPTSAPPERDLEVLAIAESMKQMLALLQRSAGHVSSSRPLGAVVLAQALKRESDDLMAAAVRQARENGANWDQVGKVASISPGAARGNWSDEKVGRTLAQRADRRARSEGQALPAPPLTGLGPSPRERGVPAPRTPATSKDRAADQLIQAMAHLRETSGGSTRSIARRIAVSPSHLSMVLTGKRLPSWDVTQRFARTCDTPPEELAPLWDGAHGIPPGHARSFPEAASALQCALRAMYLAARRPDLGSLRHDAGIALSADELDGLLDPGTPVPVDWQVVDRLVRALDGRPEDVRELWEQMQSARTTPQAALWPALSTKAAPLISAAAFG